MLRVKNVKSFDLIKENYRLYMKFGLKKQEPLTEFTIKYINNVNV